MLEDIKSPSDIKSLDGKQLANLSNEIRNVIIDTVSKNGGHLASNLGMVEATIALHKVFNFPSDKLIFDVGHQCYAHKLLTGRYATFSSLRKSGGISGFTNKNESDYDVLTEGHSGTSLSSALGIAEANKLRGSNNYTVAVIGDGSLTNGLIYEALNNCSDKDINLIILVNDNEMSISKNVGGLHSYLSRIRTSKNYFHFKHGIEYVFAKIPLIGKPLAKMCLGIKNFFKRMFIKENIFEALGLSYLGPVDGNNIERLSNVLTEAKTKHSCCVVHMTTKKGFGYDFSEKNPEAYHSVSPFDKSKGVIPCNKRSFSDTFGDIICRLAQDDERICAITAAMCSGTGLCDFAQKFPDRFFDVGIAEEHAVTFAGGLSLSGLKPVLALYSTFAQRSYDELFHDISIQSLPLVLALDRCGLVEGDGITHQGIFDYSILSTLPGAKIYAPENYREFEYILKSTISEKGLSVVRYPKGCEITNYTKSFVSSKDGLYTYTENADKATVLIVTCGRLTYRAYCALEALKGKYNIGILKLIRVFPVDGELIRKFAHNAKLVYVLEENIKSGSMAEKIATLGLGTDVVVNAIDGYVEHGSLFDLYTQCGFTEEQIAAQIEEHMNGKI